MTDLPSSVPALKKHAWKLHSRARFPVLGDPASLTPRPCRRTVHSVRGDPAPWRGDPPLLALWSPLLMLHGPNYIFQNINEFLFSFLKTMAIYKGNQCFEGHDLPG